MIWLLILLSLTFFHTRGFISHDEGWVLNAASRILDGQVPYRDFYFLYTPGSIFSVALFFNLLGESILTARILALLFSLLSVFFLYKILEHVTSDKLLAISSILLFLVWGPFQINFVWMAMLAITSGLATIYFFLKSNDNPNYVYFAGVSAAITLLFKQNFGLAIILVSIAAFVFNNKLRGGIKLLNFVLGSFFVIGLFVIYLLSNNSLLIFVEQMRYLLFQKILIEGMLSSPFIYPDALLKQILKTLSYLLPAVIALYAIYILFKRNRKMVFLPFFSLLYYTFSIRPTTDFIHLAPLMAISGIPISLIYKYSDKNIIKKIAFVVLISLILVGSYIVIFRGYYRWEGPILLHNIFYSQPKINIFVDGKFKEVLDEIEPELRKSESEDIFIYHFAPMFYFVSGKKNPTYFDDLQPSLLSNKVQNEIISQLKTSRVDTVLTNSNLKSENTLITNYILTNYEPYKTIHDYIIWKSTTELFN